MGTDQTKKFEQTVAALEKSNKLLYDYWQQYSNMSTWQFWILLLLLILPLVALYLYMDRRKALLLGFFGFNVHAWFHYCDLYTSTHGQTSYPYKMVPFLPVSAPLDVSLVPVAYMFVYQWVTKHQKNFYLYAAGLSAAFSFLLKPALVTFGLFRIQHGMNYFYLFIAYLAIAFLSKWITDIFVYFQNGGEKTVRPRRKVKLMGFLQQKQKAR